MPRAQTQPLIQTNRLLLRPFKRSDSERVALLAGEKVIADMTANIPHPYEPYMAIDWIETHQDQYEHGTGVVYAITLKGSDDIIGAVSFPTLNDGLGDLGYWLGVPYWGRGIAFEAAQALIEFGKQHLGLNQVKVMHLVENERSKSVINKLGIQCLGLRTHEIQSRQQQVVVYQSGV